jgi:hypothetical protein
VTDQPDPASLTFGGAQTSKLIDARSTREYEPDSDNCRSWRISHMKLHEDQRRATARVGVATRQNAPPDAERGRNPA